MKDLHARVPVNTTTSRVMSKGTHYQPKDTILSACSDLPIPTRPIPEAAKITPSWRDFTGFRFGTLVVVGLAAAKEGGAGGGCKWVCRCVCGRYTTRKTRVVKVADPNDCCSHCHHIETLRRQATFAATGVWPERDGDRRQT